ncbi:proteasome maturation factor UMP1 family member [Capsaspora owczarzaki ATCC 30864]|uniref:Proteasome maturation factor UMP1 family member n=2 Tax=Capsaspora owczarzaki (strain ATCC 30864) TaxID=595528 RepID=A0A0D2UGN2_CAPO3|nr:proteasome maturation factor UMP1 family member [Capsaspora owczarzaki ATCC 30864]
MRHGLHQARDDLAPLHPVAFIQDTFDAHQDHLRLSMLGLTQGQQAVMRLNMERNILSRVWRGPGLPSSNIGLETITGRDDRIAWEDVLNDPNMSEVSPALHETAEARLRL